MGMNATLHAKDISVTNPAGDATWQPIKSSLGVLASGEVGLYSSKSADGAAKTGPGVFYGVVVTTALSAAICEIRDGIAAGGGTVLFTIPASAAAGTIYKMPAGMTFSAGLYVDFAGTGTVNVCYL